MKNKRLISNILLGTILVLAVVSGWFTMLRPGVNMNGRFYVKKGSTLYQADKTHFIRLTEENTFEITEGTRIESLTLTMDNMTFQAKFGNGFSFDGSYCGGFLLDSKNNFIGSPISVSIGNATSPLSREAMVLAACQINLGDIQPRGHWIIMVFGLLTCLVSIYTYRDPEGNIFIQMRHWAYDSWQLSDEGILLSLVGSGIGFLLGLLLTSGLFVFFIK